MKTNKFGRKVSLSEDIDNEIVDGLANSGMDEAVVNAFIESKHRSALVESIMRRIAEHADSAGDTLLD